MTSESRRLSILRVKVALLISAPLLAWAAGGAAQAARRVPFDDVPLITWLFIVGFALLGWAVSEIDKLAELWNVDGHSPYEIWKARFGLIKGFAASCAAGLLVYMLGTAAPKVFLRVIGVDIPNAEMPEMFLFVFVSGAGYMGVRWFAWFESKVFNK